MVLVDYEDYDEVETISSDDIYYDAGQAHLIESFYFPCLVRSEPWYLNSTKEEEWILVLTRTHCNLTSTFMSSIFQY